VGQVVVNMVRIGFMAMNICGRIHALLALLLSLTGSAEPGVSSERWLAV